MDSIACHSNIIDHSCNSVPLASCKVENPDPAPFCSYTFIVLTLPWSCALLELLESILLLFKRGELSWQSRKAK
jgi:hypothetical protein